MLRRALFLAVLLAGIATSPAHALSAPQGLQGSCNGAVNSFTWNTVAGADYYALRRSERPNVTTAFPAQGDRQQIQAPTTAAFDVPSLPDAKTYRYSVRAHDAAGWSGESSYVYCFGDDFSALQQGWHTCAWWAKLNCHGWGVEAMATDHATSDGANLNLLAENVSKTLPAECGASSATYTYTSGMASTGGSTCLSPSKPALFAYTYGTVEARIKFPKGQGYWSAFWEMAQDHSWPPEFDIAEPNQHNNSASSVTTVPFHIHYGPGDLSVSHDHTGAPDISADFHNYGLIWNASGVDFTFDGVSKWHYDEATDSGDQIPDKAMFVYLTQQVNGSPDSTKFPGSMLVDWIHATAEQVP